MRVFVDVYGMHVCVNAARVFFFSFFPLFLLESLCNSRYSCAVSC